MLKVLNSGTTTTINWLMQLLLNQTPKVEQAVWKYQ